MLANLIYSQLARVLVIVPSSALRIQVGKKFVSLGVLPMIGVIPTTIARPRVAFITTGIRSLEEAQTIIAESNVIVALPDSLKESSEEALAYIADRCTDLIVDEAHHYYSWRPGAPYVIASDKAHTTIRIMDTV